MSDPASKRGNKFVIRTPDQRLRVFISSTLLELAKERVAAQRAITNLRMTPILFELGARALPRAIYIKLISKKANLYWYLLGALGWVALDMDISGLEHENRLA